MADSQNKHPADCGRTYSHHPHLFRTPRDKVKACDGSTTKRE